MTPGIPPPLAFPRHRPDNDLNVTPRFQRMFRSKVIAAQRFRILDLVSRGQESPKQRGPSLGSEEWSHPNSRTNDTADPMIILERWAFHSLASRGEGSTIPGSRRDHGEEGTPRRRKRLLRTCRSHRMARVASEKARAPNDANRADRSQAANRGKLRRPKPICRLKSLASKSLRRTERSQSCRTKPAALNEASLAQVRWWRRIGRSRRMKPIAPKKAVAQNDANRAAPCEGKDAAPHSPSRSLLVMGNRELGRVIPWRISEFVVESRSRSIGHRRGRPTPPASGPKPVP
jgi:hypothetical protein